MTGKQPFVGIWWFYGGKPLFVHSVPLSLGNHYGDAVTGIKDHADYWEELGKSGALSIIPPEFRDEYFYIPRGRVVFHGDTESFTVYHGNNISKKDLRKVRSVFNLPKDRTFFEEDIHYFDLSSGEWDDFMGTP